MSKRYYASFPAAPIELVATIASKARIPSILDARVSADNAVFLDVAQDADNLDGFRLTAQHLADIAEVCGVELRDVFVEAGEEDTVSITAWATHFDFSKLFVGGPHEGSICDPRAERRAEALAGAASLMERVLAQLPGEEDSEEMIEATEAVIKTPRT